MNDLVPLFVIALGLAAGLATITIWAPRRLAIKIGAFAITVLFVPLAYAGFANLLSKPKPVDLEWAHRNATEATVLAATLRENEAIFLWLQLEDVAEPRAYVMPWDRQMAEQLQDALREAEANRSGLRMRFPFEQSLDEREPKFYTPPPPMRPPKDGGGDGPMMYRHPGAEA